LQGHNAGTVDQFPVLGRFSTALDANPAKGGIVSLPGNAKK
jgi:hypothetical protein